MIPKPLKEDIEYWESILKPLGLILAGFTDRRTCLAYTPDGSTLNINSSDVAETIRKALHNEQ